MITFRRRTWVESVMYHMLPRYRRRKDAETLAAIERLTRQPWLSCVVDGLYIPNGYGNEPRN